jgi:hypothetical protein
MLNIRTKAVQPTITFQLCDADDTPMFQADGTTPVNVTVHGPGSKVFLTAQQSKSDKVLAKVMKGKEAKLSMEEAASSQVDFLAAITESMDVDYDGLEGRAKFRAVYADTSLGFIADQVNKKVGDWGNFKAQSATN